MSNARLTVAVWPSMYSDARNAPDEETGLAHGPLDSPRRLPGRMRGAPHGNIRVAVDADDAEEQQMPVGSMIHTLEAAAAQMHACILSRPHD